MFDRYNYMVYKVTTTNTSSGTAEIDYLEYFLRAMNTEQNNNQGMTPRDLKQWMYVDGRPVLNPDYPNELLTDLASQSNLPLVQAETTDRKYIGVPNKGGVLIYNTSNWLEQDYEDLDKMNFSNLDKIIRRANEREPIYTDVPDPEGKGNDKRLLTYDDSNDGDYDVTGVFENGEAVVTTPSIPYQTNNQPGYVNFEVTDEQGHLYPNEKVLGTGHGTYSFIVAFPYTTNINQSVGSKGMGYYVSLSPQTTIFFGKLGSKDRDYSWSDSASTFSYPFGIPEATLKTEKYVENKYQGVTSNPSLKPVPDLVTSTTYSYLGYPVSYEINNLVSQGNMPLYGTVASSTTQGPAIIDTLPNFFRLYNLEIAIDSATDMDSDKTTALSQYFDTVTGDFQDGFDAVNRNDSAVVQFEVSTPSEITDEQGNTTEVDELHWVNLGTPQYVRTEPYTGTDEDGAEVTRYKHIYRLGGEDKASSLAQKLADRGISPLPGVPDSTVYEQDDMKDFTGKMRIVLKTPVSSGITLPITLRVNGTMTLPLADYKNTVEVNYGKRTWNHAAQNYAANSEYSESSTATFLSAVSPTPQVSATAVAMAATLYDDKSAILPTEAAKQPILSRTGSGWRFKINNNSASKMEPATFTVGNAYGAAEAAGFTTERIGINQGILDMGTISKIDITYRSPKDGALETTHAVFEGEKLRSLISRKQAYLVDGKEIYQKNLAGNYIDARGDELPDQDTKTDWVPNGIVITPEEWLSGYFVSMSITFDELKGKQDIGTRDLYVEVQGAAEDLATMEMSGTLTTNYEKIASQYEGRNVSARATASFTSRKAPYNLGITVTGMRESQVPGDKNAFVGNLEYVRDNNGNIYYTDSEGHRGIIEDGVFKYGTTERSESRKPFDESSIFRIYRDSEETEGLFKGNNFVYRDANDEEQIKAWDVRETEGVTGSIYLDPENHQGTLSGTTFTYKVKVDQEVREDFLFEAVTQPYVGGVLLTAKTTTDNEGKTTYVFDDKGNMIYVDGSGNEGYIKGTDFVLADGSTLPVTNQPRKDTEGHDLYVDREGHEGYIDGGIFTYTYDVPVEGGQPITQTGTKPTVFSATNNKVTVDGTQYDEYTNSEGIAGYVTDDGWFVYTVKVDEERTKEVKNILMMKRDTRMRALYSDGTNEGTKDGNEFVYFVEVDNSDTKPVDPSMQPVVEKDDAGADKLFEGYIGDPGSGWRFTVANDSAYDIGNAAIKAGVVLEESGGEGKPVDSVEETDTLDSHGGCTTKIDYRDGDQYDFEASHIAISPALWKVTRETVYETDSCGMAHRHTATCPGANPVVKDVRKGGIPSDLILEVWNANSTSMQNSQYKTIPGTAFRALTDLFTAEDRDALRRSNAAFAGADDATVNAELHRIYDPTVSAYGLSLAMDGTIVVTLANCAAWKSGNYYLRGLEQKFVDFGAGLTLEDGGYLDIYGTVTNKAEMWVGGIFTTDYARKQWNSAIDSVGVLNGAPYPADGTPIVKAFSDMRGDDEKDSNNLDYLASGQGYSSPLLGYRTGMRIRSTTGSDVTEVPNYSVPARKAYYDYDDTGYRINLANNTKYAINLGAYFSVDAVPSEALDATKSDASKDTVNKLVDFETHTLTLSRELFTGQEMGANDTQAYYAGKMIDARLWYYDLSDTNKATLKSIGLHELVEHAYQQSITMTTEGMSGYKGYTEGNFASATVPLPTFGGKTDAEGDPAVTVDPATGNYVLDWGLWDEGYLVKVDLDYGQFNNWVNEDTNAYIELRGKTTNLGNFQVNTTFKTKQAIEEWTRSWTSAGRITSTLAPIRPTMNMGAYGYEADVDSPGEENANITPGNTHTYGGINTMHMNKTTLYNTGTYRERNEFNANYYNRYPITSSEVRDDKPIAYRNEENSGYRAVVTNDSDHAMRHGAKLTIGNLTPRWDEAEWDYTGDGHKKGEKPGEALDKNLGYHTSYLTLSKGLIENSEIESVTIKWAPAYSKYTSGKQLTAWNHTNPDSNPHRLVNLRDLGDPSSISTPTTWTWEQIQAKWMGKDANGNWDGENINIPAGEGWFGGDAYWFEVKFKTVDSHLTVEDNAYVDLFGYGIDSPNVNNATDPYYAESDDYYQYGDSYNVVHVGMTHGWGCWGGGNAGTSSSRIDREFLGRYAYVGNYYVVVDADSELKALYPNTAWSTRYGIGNGASSGTNSDGERTYAQDQANLYAIGGQPKINVRASTYFQPEKSLETVVNTSSLDALDASTSTTTTAGQTKAWWGENGAAYRFNVSNGARSMFESELRIGTTDGKYWMNAANAGIKYGAYTPQGTTVSYEVVPGTDDKEIYHNVVRGFQTKAIAISKVLRQGSKIAEVEITYFPKVDPTTTNLPLWKGVDSAVAPVTTINNTASSTPHLMRKTMKYSYLSGNADSTGATGGDIDATKMTTAYDNEGNLIIPWTEWDEGYITNVVIRFNEVKPNTGYAADGTTEDNSAYVDMWGYADNVRDMPLSAWFGCTYDYNGWHYDRDEPSRPYGTNVKNYAWGSWPNKWTWNSNSASAWGSGYTRVGDWVQFMTDPGWSVRNWCVNNAADYSYITSHWNPYMPQFKRCVASWQKYWKGANAYHNGAATAWIMGRPYEVDETIKAETFMRSDDATSEYGYDDYSDGITPQESGSGKLELRGTTTGYYEDKGSGYRFTLYNGNPNDKEPKDVADTADARNNMHSEDGHFTMSKAYFATKKIAYTDNKDDEEVKAGKKERGYVNFTTKKVAFTKQLLDVDTYDIVRVKDVTLSYTPYKIDDKGNTLAGVDEAITIDGADLIKLATAKTDADLKRQKKNADGSLVFEADGVTPVMEPIFAEVDGVASASIVTDADELKTMTAKVTAADGTVLAYRQPDGDVIINREFWGGHYFRNVEMHLRDFKSITAFKDVDDKESKKNLTNYKRAYVEFWGEGTYRWVGWSMYSTLRTDWLTPWWNYNNQHNTNAAGSYSGYTNYSTLTLRDDMTEYQYRTNTLTQNYKYNAALYHYPSSGVWSENYSIGAYNTFGSELGDANHPGWYTYWRPLGGYYQNDGVWLSPYGDYQTPSLAKEASMSGNAPYTTTVSSCLNIALPPVRPVTAMYSYKDADTANKAFGDLKKYETPRYDSSSSRWGSSNTNHSVISSYTFGTEPRAYWRDEAVGYRALFANKSRYAMTHGAQIRLGNILPISDPNHRGLLENAGFRTTRLSLSREMYDAGIHDVTNADGTVTENVNGIKSITLYWYAKDARAVARSGQSYIATSSSVADTDNNANASTVFSTTYTGEQVSTWFKEKKHIAVVFEKNEDGTYKKDASGEFIPKRDEDGNIVYEDGDASGLLFEDGDVLLNSTMWSGGDLAGMLIEYDWYQNDLTREESKLEENRGTNYKNIKGNEAYVDFFGYTIDSPNANDKREITDTWCVNHGWEQGDGGSVTQYWDWFYTQVRLSTEFKTTYGAKNWNNLFKGSDNGTHNGYHNGYNGGYDGKVTYDTNYYSELTRTTDYGDLFAHMPASSQKVAAKSYFVDAATPLGAASPLADTTTAWLRYYGAGWRFTYTNYANPTTITSRDYADSTWNKDANVYDRDYEMFDSYIQVGAMPADAVPSSKEGDAVDETADYDNDFRGFDAKYITLSSGLIDAVTWGKSTWDNATWHKAAMTGNGLGADKAKGNAIKTIRITTYPSTKKGNTVVPVPTPVTPTTSDDGSGDSSDSGSSDDDEGGDGDGSGSDSGAGSAAAPDPKAFVEGTVTDSKTGATVTTVMENGKPKVTYVFTLDQLLAAGATYTAQGNLQIPSTVWGDGYFLTFRMDMYHFNKSVKEANNAVIDVLGRTDTSQRNITLASTFNTCYDTNLTDGNNHLANAVHEGTWDHTADTYGDWTGYINGGSILQDKTVDKNGNKALAYKYLGSSRYSGYNSTYARSNGMDRIDAATLVAVNDPIRPRIGAYTFLYAENAGDVNGSMEWSNDSTPNTPIDTLMGSMNSGWRFPLTNDSNYAMDSARVTLGSAYTSGLVSSETSMYDDDRGSAGNRTPAGATSNYRDNYDGGAQIYGELVDGLWRGFEPKTLFVNAAAMDAILAETVARKAKKDTVTPGGSFGFEQPGATSAKKYIAPVVDRTGTNNLTEDEVKAALAGYTVDIYAVGLGDNDTDDAYKSNVQMRRMQGNGTYADESVTIVTSPTKPITEMYRDEDDHPIYETIQLADYVKKVNGRWVISIPSEAWMHHGEACNAKNGVDHNVESVNPTANRADCKNELYVTRVVFHLPSFAAQVTETDPTKGDCAVIEMHGVPTRATVMSLNGEFSTEYLTENWTTRVPSTAITPR